MQKKKNMMVLLCIFLSFFCVSCARTEIPEKTFSIPTSEEIQASATVAPTEASTPTPNSNLLNGIWIQQEFDQERIAYLINGDQASCYTIFTDEGKSWIGEDWGEIPLAQNDEGYILSFNSFDVQIVDINETTFNAIYDQSEQKVFIRVTDPEILSLFPNVPATDTSGTDSPSSNMKIDAVLEEEFIATLTEKYPDSTNSIKLEELSGEDYTYYQINSQFGRIYYVVDNKTNIVSSCSALIGSSNFSLDEISTWKKDIVRSFSAIEVPDLKGSEHLGKQPYNYDEKSELFFEITLNPILRALNEMGISSNTEVENDLYLFSLNHGDNSYAFALSSYLEESAKDTITANPIEDSSEAYASVLANMP